MPERARVPRKLAVYEGGARGLRSTSGAVAVGLLLVSAVALVLGWTTGSPAAVWAAAVATVAAPLAVITVKLSARRTVEIANAGFSLAPLVGKRRTARARRVVTVGEDVIVESDCGRVFVLGVPGGSERSELARRTLVAGLSGFGTEEPTAGR